MFSNKHILYYLYCFCPDSSFALLISWENPCLFTIKPTQTGHQMKILGMVSVRFQCGVKNNTKEPNREVKSKEGVNVPVPYLNCVISQRMICWLRLTLHPVLKKTD